MKRPIAAVMSTGRGIPAKIMTNHDFASIGIETSHEWIVERSGIVERHLATETETTASMAATASRQAMERAGVHPGQLDAIVLSTATPDRLLPATAVDLQAELGASRAAAFDIGAACSGFIYGMTVAEGMIATGAAETILVVSAEKMSSIVDWTDRATCVLFGDGAGAVILQRARTGKGILSTFLRSDGQLADLLYRPAGGAKIPMSAKVLEERGHFVKMAGREVFKHAVRSMSEAADRALDGARLTGADVDLLIPHQANVRIIEATAKHSNIPMEKVYVNVDRYGNTSSASIPIAIDEAIEKGIIKEGTTVMCVAFGAGFTWGSMIIRF
ncbi:MAG TPA: beta-ketoacyl-ACP synthase III [Gemmatimonadaceae bacterium]|nr:beta-ketoacyl-ACP synthase III [Gemmatimonadaceae bacterium]